MGNSNSKILLDHLCKKTISLTSIARNFLEVSLVQNAVVRMRTACSGYIHD